MLQAIAFLKREPKLEAEQCKGASLLFSVTLEYG